MHLTKPHHRVNPPSNANLAVLFGFGITGLALECKGFDALCHTSTKNEDESKQAVCNRNNPMRAYNVSFGRAWEVRGLFYDQVSSSRFKYCPNIKYCLGRQVPSLPPPPPCCISCLLFIGSVFDCRFGAQSDFQTTASQDSKHTRVENTISNRIHSI